MHRVAGEVRGGWIARTSLVVVLACALIGGAFPAAALVGAESEGDTQFTIAVLPDTQRETHPATDMRGERRADWLVANRDRLDIRAVLSVGDVVQWDTPDHAMYEKASGTFQRLEVGGVPWVPAVGNHDSAAVCEGGSACPGSDASIAVRDTRTFNSYFPPSRFPLMRDLFEPGKVDNATSAFRAGGMDWLVVSLELWPRPEAVSWANGRIAAHPDSNVIVLTHMYLDDQGRIPTDVGGYGATSPRYLYDNLISKHSNIKLVLNGHRGHGTAHRIDFPGGNPVVSWNNSWHSATTNPVMLLSVDTAAGRVTSATYAPDTDEWFKAADARYDGMQWVAITGNEAGSGFVPITPSRLADTRSAGGVLAAGEVLRVPVAGRAGVPADAAAAALNVTVTGSEAGGWLRAWPCGGPVPVTSNLNFSAGQTVANAVLAGVGSTGEICLEGSTAAHAVVDLMGYHR